MDLQLFFIDGCAKFVLQIINNNNNNTKIIIIIIINSTIKLPIPRKIKLRIKIKPITILIKHKLMFIIDTILYAQNFSI